MLSFKLKPAEAIYLDDTIAVRLLGVTGGQVRIGVVAPKTIQVHREEIYKRINDKRDQDLDKT